MDITTTAPWSALQSIARPATCARLFADDPQRSMRYRLQAGDLMIDYSKHLLDDEVMRRLLAVAATAGIEARRTAMFAGEAINVTERRAVLHTALRAPRDAVVLVDGHNVVPDVHEVLSRITTFADRVRSGAWRGATGETMQTVVNIGIGGSDLGPAMAFLATESFGDHNSAVSLRQQRRWRRHHRQPRRSRPGDDAVHHQLEDVHHDRDVDQRASGAPLVDDASLGNGCRQQALRRGQHQRRRGRRVRHRHREHVRLLGLGRGSLLGRLGHRAVAGPVDRARPGSVSSSTASTPSICTFARHRCI